MLNNRKFSISRVTKVMPVLVIILIVVNIIAVSLIGTVYFSVHDADESAVEYFRSFNEYVLVIRSHESSRIDSIKDGYLLISDEFEQLGILLKKDGRLQPPDFNDLGERNEYVEILRKHAAVIRQNLSDGVKRSYFIIGVMLLISLIASVVITIIMLYARKAIVSYHKEISLNLCYMEKLLTFEKQPDYQMKKSQIIEVEKLNNAIYSMSSDISFNRGLMDTAFHGNLYSIMNNLFSSFEERMPCDRIALAFIDTEGNCTAETAVTSYKSAFLNPGYSEILAATNLQTLIQSGKPRIINDLEDYASNRIVSEATVLIMKEGLRSSITVPMMFEGKCLGFFFVACKQTNVYDEMMANYASRVINLMKQKFYIEYLLQEVISETSNAFVGLMEEKDNETSEHILRMSHYSNITVRAYHEIIMPLSPRFMREILWYAPLHDIGKVGTPDAILMKEGPLTPKEMEVMKGHVKAGVRVMDKMNERLGNIVSAPLMQTAVDIIAGHHEKYNGQGYPDGVSGSDIPLAGRIVAIADVFDALTSKRPYKDALSIEEALKIIENEMADSFDPDVLAAFKHGLPDVREVYERLKEV